MSRANENELLGDVVCDFVRPPPWAIFASGCRDRKPDPPNGLPSRIASGLPENLIGQIGSDWDAKLFALVRLHHQQYPEDDAHEPDESEESKAHRKPRKVR